MFSQPIHFLPILFALAGVTSAVHSDKRDDAALFLNTTSGPDSWDIKLDSLTPGGSWLMAPLAGLAYHNQDYLERKMVWSEQDPQVKVKLFGIGETNVHEYSVDKGAFKDIAWSMWGNIQWPMAFASAVQAMAKEHANDAAYPIHTDLGADAVEAAYQIIYGSSYSTAKITELSDDNLFDRLDPKGASTVLVDGALGTFSTDGLNGGQYWTVYSYDKGTKKLQLRNPWGIIGRKSNTELIDGQFEGMNKGHGVLEIDLDFFKRNFVNIIGFTDNANAAHTSVATGNARRAEPTA